MAQPLLDWLQTRTETGMDALSLVLPAAPIANNGANGADAGAQDASGDAAPVDFAALLAAGLVPQDAASVLPVAPAEVQAADKPAKPEGDEALADVSATPLAALPIALQSPAGAHGSAASKDAARATLTNAAAPSAAATAGNGKPGAHVAAEAATIAGAAAQNSLTKLVEQETLETGNAADAVQGAPAEPNASLGHLLHLGAAEPAAARPSAMLEVAAPVHGPDFAAALSQQVVWMADKDAQVAELRINPPELGPVEVRLHISGDDAVVQFASAHAEVRSAIEASLDRLRESMAQAGVQLGQTSVSAESFRDQSAQGSGAGEHRKGYRTVVEQTDPQWTPAPIASGVRRGLVDLFA
jgi:flagellar hook-length control protein FliK